MASTRHTRSSPWLLQLLVGLAITGFTIYVVAYSNVHSSTRWLFSLVMVIIGLLTELGTVVRAQNNELKETILEFRGWLTQQIPELDTFEVIATTHEAFEYLISALDEASFIRNTRIPTSDSPDGAHQLSPGSKHSANASPFRDDLKKYLKSGRHFREVIANREGLIQEATQLYNQFGTAGHYQFAILPHSSSVFLNFSLIQYRQSERIPEVLIGWATSAGSAFDDRCFLLRGEHIHSYFSGLFDSLWHTSQTRTFD